MENLNTSYITPFIGALALLIFAIDRIYKYKSDREDHKIRKKQIEEERNFKREQFDEEKRIHQERLNWLERETIKLTEASVLLGEKIAEELGTNTDWAVRALNKARLTPYAQTLFMKRMADFQYEKEFISSKFVPLILSRCKRIINEGKKVVLIIDSGTTLFSTFEHFGKELIKYYNNKEEWIKQLTLVTNNLSGIDSFMRHGCVNSSCRYSALVIDCQLLPGEPLPIYSGVTGSKTIKALDEYMPRDDSRVTILLTTGNWARVRKKDPQCPIPIVRGYGHYEVKQKMIDISNEIYMLAPLGKTLINRTPGAINETLGLSEADNSPDKELYVELGINKEKAKSVKYVSTSRVNNRVLSELSAAVMAILDNHESQYFDSFTTSDIECVPHLFFPFDDLPDEWHFQFEQEVPHPQTRSSAFLEKFLLITQKQM